jgi:leucyl aminopeptidase
MRILLENNLKPKQTIEFHWYAAEEFGLLGSQEIAVNYKRQKKDVVGMLQLDMIGYLANKDAPHIGLEIGRHVNSDINGLLHKLITEYAEAPLQDKSTNGGSDHASWAKVGYPAAYLQEAETNPNYHTDQDTIDTIDFDYLSKFVKLALAFATELSS